jgi:hypothetical protein
LKAEAQWCRRYLKLKDTENAVITNGRVRTKDREYANEREKSVVYASVFVDFFF